MWKGIGRKPTMNTSLDCLPCLFRQTLDAARRVSDDPAFYEQVVKEVAGWVQAADLSQPPPVLAQRIHRLLRERTGVVAPYASAKARDNALALSLLPEFQERLARASDPLFLAVRLAIAGNLIDLGPKHELSAEEILSSIRQVENEPFSGDVESLRNVSARAKHILYLADNAGEIVFDRLLVERLGASRVTVAVRGAPIINDATLADARTAGLCEVAEVITNGSDAPGTVLPDCSPEFLEHFKTADLVISKGQGNFETLSSAPRDICFLFKVKCPVVAAKAGLPLGTQALLWSRAGEAGKGSA